MTTEEEVKRFRERRDSAMRHYKEVDDADYISDDEKERRIEETIYEYAKKKPDFVKRFIEDFTPIKEKENNNQNRVFKKFAPYAFIGMAILSSIGGAVGGAKLKEKQIENNTIQISQSYESNYKSIEDAPLEIQIAYVEAQDDNYRDAINVDPNLRNEEFESIISRYAAAKENNDLDQIAQCAELVSKIADEDTNDKIDSFLRSKFSRAYVDANGNVFIKMENKNDFVENEEYIYKDGGFSKGI